jgi:hypothetical protein
MLGDAHGVDSEEFGAPNQIHRFKPVVVRVLRMAMGVDPHGLSLRANGLMATRIRD